MGDIAPAVLPPVSMHTPLSLDPSSCGEMTELALDGVVICFPCWVRGLRGDWETPRLMLVALRRFFSTGLEYSAGDSGLLNSKVSIVCRRGRLCDVLGVVWAPFVGVTLGRRDTPAGLVILRGLGAGAATLEERIVGVLAAGLRLKLGTLKVGVLVAEILRVDVGVLKVSRALGLKAADAEPLSTIEKPMLDRVAEAVVGFLERFGAGLVASRPSGSVRGEAGRGAEALLLLGVLETLL